MLGKQSPLGTSFGRTIGLFVVVALMVTGYLAVMQAPLTPQGRPSAPQNGLSTQESQSTVGSQAATHPVAPAFVSPRIGNLYSPAHPLAIGNCTTTPVVPGCGFSAEPAPMGIADYGVSGYGHPTYYAYGTTAFLGVINWTNAYIYSSGQGGSFSIQLNVVLNFINGGKNYSYWIQNVPVPDDSTKNDLAMSYANNIWNFSCASTTCNLATNTVTGNGTDSGGVYVWPKSGNSGCAGGGSGTCDTLDGPSWTAVEVRSFLSASGSPEVRFCYFDKLNPTMKCYDTVTFGFAHHVTLDRGFFVDGLSMNPTGLFEDAELTIGGPGGGASTTNTGPSNIHMTLDYWNGHNFQSVPSAWNAGDDTAEALSSDQSIFSNDGSGTPLTVQLNGTTREDFENPSYTMNQVGELQVVASGMTSGKVVVKSAGWAYQGGEANLTLVPGTYHVWDNGTSSYDLGMCTITAGSTLTVTLPSTCSGGGTPLSLSTFGASPNPVAAGSLVTFTVTTTGGTAPLFYNYTGLPAGCTTQDLSTFSCTPNTVGTYYVNATVNDSAAAHTTKTITLTVTLAPLSFTTFSASPNPVAVGNTVTFTASASGGTAPLKYSYTGLPPGCSTQDLASFGCPPSTYGTFSVNATVNDSAGASLYKTITLTVSPVPLAIGTFSATPNPVSYGVATMFSVTATGGATPLTYSYTGLPAGCSSQSLAQMSCTPTAVGKFTVQVTVKDSMSDTAVGYLNLTVSAPILSITTFAANPGTINLGTSTNLTATVSGTGTLTYSYSSPAGSGCVSANAATIKCTPTGAGTYTIELTLSDTFGSTVFQNASFTVNLPAAPVIASFTVSPSTITVGGNTTFHVKTTGGVAPLMYAYSNLPTGCANSSTSTLGCTPANVGHYNITVTVRDSAGRVTSPQTVALYVKASIPAITLVTLTPSPSEISLGQSIWLNVTVTGGTQPFSYSFSGLPSGCTSASVASLLCTPTSAGNYSVSVKVTDVNRETGSASAIARIAAAPPTTGSSSGFLGLSTTDWMLIIIIAIVAIAIVAAVMRRRSMQEPPSEVEYAAATPVAAAPGLAGPSPSGPQQPGDYPPPPQEGAPYAAPEAAAPAAAAASGMMVQCPACGAGVMSGDATCSRCMNPMPPPG